MYTITKKFIQNILVLTATIAMRLYLSNHKSVIIHHIYLINMATVLCPNWFV